ncbi:MAG: AbrB/MazE/SpoVT family DNA-binding domain-containing protein [Thaumarchaeota archaeon]|nr:AbrB/MazE/SpoVT family DNA-binding domain-containing protein [Nitrososphaerota archaeon]
MVITILYGFMSKIATVTSKSMVTIPSKLRKKLDLRQGSKVEFVEVEEGLLMIPLKSLGELRGAAKEKKAILVKAVKELDVEHRIEAKG